MGLKVTWGQGAKNMSWDKSEVMTEFLKIADTDNVLGLEKAALPSPNPYQEDVETIKEKKLEQPEKNIVEEAHPHPVYVAESQGDGGLVENQIEQQNKLIEMVNKYPTGSLVGRYAYAVNRLVKMAEAAEEVGALDVADALTDTARDIIDQMSNTLDAMNNSADNIDAELEVLVDEDAIPFMKAPTKE